ncbi:putative membrane protein YdbK [Vallitalea longa]|uniref:Membrane protein YdbK n=1 Tax=Vallitalea longa TaxID=2936439 RepID=A0A9W6DES2_9FIRM|nr:ABC transporter permease subunit [Vallitalea longa]GKX29820.1 putative membrane protein YdbK [Vallitalea longa]
MHNIVKNELIKIFKSKRIYIFMGILVLLALVPCIGNLIFNSGNNEDIIGQLLPIETLQMYLEILLPILITVLVSDMYTEEYSSGTLKLQMIHPITRGKFLLSKVIALGISILSLLIFAMLTTYLFGMLFFGWGDYFMLQGTTYSTGEGILLTFSSYLISSLPLLSFGMLILLISMKFHSGSATVGTGIGIFLILTYVNKLIKSVKPYLITNYFDLYSLLTKPFDFNEAVTYVGVLAIYGIGSYIISCFIFSKKDILY